MVAAFALFACARSPTEILVVVNSDFAVPSGLDRIVVQSYDSAGAVVDATVDAHVTDSAVIDGSATDSATGDGGLADAEVDDAGTSVFPTYPAVPTQTISDPASGSGHRFGSLLAASAAGDTLVVADPYLTKVYVYNRTGANFGTTPDETLTAPSGTDGFATSGIALSPDGSLLAVTVTNLGNPQVLLYARSGALFSTTPTQTIGTPADGNGGFGSAAAFSADNSILAVGNNGSDTAGAFIYEHGAFGFASTPSQTIASVRGTPDVSFGSAIALCANASTLAIGDPDPTSGVGGHAYVFTRDSGPYGSSPTATVSTPATTNLGQSAFGIGVALTADSEELVVSDTTEGNDGAVYAFKREGSAYTHLMQTIAHPTGAARFGADVAVTGDGRTLFVGGSQVYIYAAE